MSLAQLFLMVEVSDNTVVLVSGLLWLPVLQAVDPRASITAHSIAIFFIISDIYVYITNEKSAVSLRIFQEYPQQKHCELTFLCLEPTLSMFHHDHFPPVQQYPVFLFLQCHVLLCDLLATTSATFLLRK